MSTETLTPGNGDLLARLAQANHNAYASITQTLIGSLQGQVTDLQAKLDAIRDRIMAALDGPYMPTPAHLESLLWPADDIVAHYRPKASQ